MTVSKTKAKLVDVARQLFAKMGVENTTMNDIALASKKGRRTLYTYFKSKEDIYMAVVESELDMLSDMMKRVAEKNISPDEKMIEMIYTRLDAVKEVVFRNGTLRANFFRDIWRVEKVRKRFDAKEILLFKDVLHPLRYVTDIVLKMHAKRTQMMLNALKMHSTCRVSSFAMPKARDSSWTSIWPRSGFAAS